MSETVVSLGDSIRSMQWCGASVCIPGSGVIIVLVPPVTANSATFDFSPKLLKIPILNLKLISCCSICAV